MKLFLGLYACIVGKTQRRPPQSKPRPQRAVQPMKKQTPRDVPLAASSDLPAAARLSQPPPAAQTRHTAEHETRKPPSVSIRLAKIIYIRSVSAPSSDFLRPQNENPLCLILSGIWK